MMNGRAEETQTAFCAKLWITTCTLIIIFMLVIVTESHQHITHSILIARIARISYRYIEKLVYMATKQICLAINMWSGSLDSRNSWQLMTFYLTVSKIVNVTCTLTVNLLPSIFRNLISICLRTLDFFTCPCQGSQAVKPSSHL